MDSDHELSYDARTLADGDFYLGLRLLWKETRLEITGETLSIDGATSTMDNVNTLFYLLNSYTGGNFQEFVMDNIGEVPVTIPDMFKETTLDSGQAKVFVGALEALAFSPCALYLVVIGSSSTRSTVGGKTYELLAFALSKLGYYGAIFLYDPYEIDQIHIVGNFTLKHFSSKIDHSQKIEMEVNGKIITPTLILDDCWTLCEEEEFPELKKITPKVVQIPEGASKFVQMPDNSIIAGLNEHSQILGAVGGGSIFLNTEDRLISIYGSSSTYGDYDSSIVFSILKEMYVGYSIKCFRSDKRAFDAAYRVLDNECRVTTKNLGNCHHEGVRVVEQHFYSGSETRIFKGVPSLGQKVFQIGDGCLTCRKIGRILGSLNNYSDTSVCDVFSEVFSAIAVKSCFHIKGQKDMRQVFAMKEMARRRVSWQIFQQAVDVSDRKRKLLMKMA